MRPLGRGTNIAGCIRATSGCRRGRWAFKRGRRGIVTGRNRQLAAAEWTLHDVWEWEWECVVRCERLECRGVEGKCAVDWWRDLRKSGPYLYVSFYILKVRRSLISEPNWDLNPSDQNLSFKVDQLPPETCLHRVVALWSEDNLHSYVLLAGQIQTLVTSKRKFGAITYLRLQALLFSLDSGKPERDFTTFQVALLEYRWMSLQMCFG